MRRETEKNRYHRRSELTLLKKKHSSGDLQSRLKTRKILGVGETNNGDVHRSKISQVLGHNEHLYIKFPRYYSIWHFLLASMYTICGLSNLLLLHQDRESMPLSELKHSSSSHTYGKLYGCEMIGFAALLWALWGKSDKSLARALLAAIAICEFLQVGVIFLSLWKDEVRSNAVKGHLILSAAIALINTHFIAAIGSSTAGLRKAPSHREITEPEIASEDSVAVCEECHNPRSSITAKSTCLACSSKKTE